MPRNVYYKNKRDRLLQDRGVAVARAYETWTGLRKRIAHPKKNKRNGSGYVGLTADPRWDDFEVFLSDMGEPPIGFSIDRIDCSVGYWPGNCRWADEVTQSRNRTYTKLNEEAAKTIRYLYASGRYSQQRLADAHRVSQRLVSKIVRGEVWV